MHTQRPRVVFERLAVISEVAPAPVGLRVGDTDSAVPLRSIDTDAVSVDTVRVTRTWVPVCVKKASDVVSVTLPIVALFETDLTTDREGSRDTLPV